MKPNEHGVYCDVETIPYEVDGAYARVHLVHTGKDWRFGVNLSYVCGSHSGHGFLPSVHDKGFKTREDAIAAALNLAQKFFAQDLGGNSCTTDKQRKAQLLMQDALKPKPQMSLF